jgi:glucose-1-phosphate cytidylyltransferase
MKALILAGGLGTRISEETLDKPKPMVSIGEYPILWHIIRIYALQGIREFIIAGGYKHEVISRWIDDSYTRNESWIKNLSIVVKDTGYESLTGSRIMKCLEVIKDERFFCTYGDGVANVNLKQLSNFHRSHGRLASLTIVRPPARFGHVSIVGDKVLSFDEKNQADEGWINGGFFLLDQGIKKFISTSNESFEKGALPRLAHAEQLMAYKHSGFWRPMDTMRDQTELHEMTVNSSIQDLAWFTFE